MPGQDGAVRGPARQKALAVRGGHLGPARRRAGRVLSATVLVLVVAVAVAVAGCSLVRGAVSTIRALDRAGFKASDVQPGGGTDGWVVTVEKDTEDLDAAAADAAGVVWHHLPLRVERLQVTCGNGFGGKGTFVADRAELERRFGARDPGLDRGIQNSDLRIVGLVVIGLVVGGLLVLGGLVLVLVLLVRRSRRCHPPPGPPGGGVPQAPPPHYRPPA